MAGYQFLVLNNAFTSHWGFQTIKGRPSWRAKQQEDNNKLMPGFAEELKAKYGSDPKDLAKLASKIAKIRVAFGKPI